MSKIKNKKSYSYIATKPKYKIDDILHHTVSTLDMYKITDILYSVIDKCWYYKLDCLSAKFKIYAIHKEAELHIVTEDDIADMDAIEANYRDNITNI